MVQQFHQNTLFHQMKHTYTLQTSNSTLGYTHANEVFLHRCSGMLLEIVGGLEIMWVYITGRKDR